VRTIDFGGGFGVPCHEGMPEFDLERFGAGFQELWAGRGNNAALAGCRPVIELGRYLVAEAGVYVTRVVDVKRSRGRTFAVADGGMHHHLAATGNMGQVFRKPYPLLNLSRSGTGGWVTLAGPCCTPLDVFGTDLPLDPVEVGDLIGIFCSGAYGYSASSLHFLSHPTPSELLVDAGGVTVLRRAGRPEDVLLGQLPLEGEA
jgi:diaminopimelate decarboxylase